MVKYSVVIPVYNEGQSIEALYFALKKVMDNIGETYEIIFINDGSHDNSYEILKTLSLKSNHFIFINLTKRFGQSSAMQLGFNTASGELIITMDGDLQNDPDDIPMLIKKMEEGYDVVCGWRYKRSDPISKKISSKIANIVRKAFFQEKIHDVGCTFRVYSKDILKNINLYGESHRFLTSILKKNGARIGEVKITHHPRRYGKSKYTILRRVYSSLAYLTKCK